MVEIPSISCGRCRYWCRHPYEESLELNDHGDCFNLNRPDNPTAESDKCDLFDAIPKQVVDQ